MMYNKNETMQFIDLTNLGKVDFIELAQKYPPLQKYLVTFPNQTTISFKNQKALIALAQATMITLLRVNVWTCPQKNLCPRIPSRINYLLWLDHCCSSIAGHKIQKVLDIGTGSTLVYPLIGNKLFGWDFIATQIDPDSYKHAQFLIQQNQLKSNIKLILSKSQTLIKGNIDKCQQIDAIICNPPFFDSLQLNYMNETQKSQYKFLTVSKMTDMEHNSIGGQYQFFFKIYSQHFEYRKIKFGSMLIGRKKDFDCIVNFLKKQKQSGILEYFVAGRIKQGTGTGNVRGIVLWSINRLQY